MTEKYKIQIVAPGRTGSTFLHQVLSDELVGDSAYRFNEPIGVPYDDLLLGGELFDEKALSDAQHVIENSKFFDSLNSDNVVVKNVVMPLKKMKDSHPILWEEYTKHNWNTVILYRQDLFSTIISYCIAEYKNKNDDDINHFQTHTAKLSNQLTFDQEYFTEKFMFYVEQYKILVEFMNEFKNHIVLAYEDFPDDHVDIKRKVHGFADLNNEDQVQHVLTKNIDNKDMIENYEELHTLFLTLVEEFIVDGIEISEDGMLSID
jgi:hypothetical protein